MCWFIIGVILICVTLFLLKQIEIGKDFDWGTHEARWEDFKIETWVFILIVTIGSIPGINIVAFFFFLFAYLFRICDEDVCFKLKLNAPNNKIIKYLKRLLTKELF